MKAGIYLGKENVEVREIPTPELDDNDVLIKNIYSSVCGTDLHSLCEVTSCYTDDAPVCLCHD